MSYRRVIAIGLLVFSLTFLAETVRLWHGWANPTLEPACEYNLKALWLLSQRVSSRFGLPFPPPLEWVKRYGGELFFLTARDAEYLGLPTGGFYTDFSGALFCLRDPKGVLKMAKMHQGLPYQPSYLWHPDSRTLAYCPFCHLAVLTDGRLEGR